MIAAGFNRNDLESVMGVSYFPTHTRMIPWIVGIIFAYILFNTREKHVLFTKVRTPATLLLRSEN